MPAEGALCSDLRLIETLLWRSDGGFWLLSGHLGRLQRSSEALGFAYGEERVRAALARAVVDSEAERLRLRLLLSPDGSLEVTASSLSAAEPGSWRLTISPARLDPQDPWLRHKTSRRALYDGERQRLCKPANPEGYDEVLFLNTRNEVSEGAITSVFADLGDGLVTPPLSCGLLPGVLRHHLLHSGEAREQMLSLDDLSRAKRLYVGNSVRGLVPARLSDDRDA